jgi:hypothetical protein
MELIDREIDALQVEIPDHEIRNRWRHAQQIVQA